ncbi:MAG: neutral/alkaline non-lysosomal ceramidase N-terminal domain-containing protein [Myxococcaceae bacterium]|nr:neutral/alkaline non-lysosomal ceramidase N-terminal domain-containing protein [Myxococcaceae bacterium]
MTKQRVLGLVALVAVGLFAFASADRCGRWPDGEPVLSGVTRGRGALAVGAAKVAVQVPSGTTVGGSPPPRASSSGGDAVYARATVVDVGGQAVALVSLDLLLIPQPLVAALRDGLDVPVLVTATHTHASVGQYDRRLAAQVASLGAFEPGVERALVDAARQAIVQARANKAPATVEVRRFSTEAFVRARSGAAVDTRATEVLFRREGASAVRWLLLAAHPTLSPRRGSTFDTDWPGAVTAALEADGSLALVLQTAVGNASTANVTSEGQFARALEQARTAAAPPEPCAASTLSLATVHLPLPRPDGSRLAPWPLTAIADNALCAAAEQEAEVTMLRLGCLSFLALPVEPTRASGAALEQLTGATTVLALANGYLGYLEPVDAARAGLGETKRQWFGAELYERVAKASLLAAMGSDPGDPHVEGR